MPLQIDLPNEPPSEATFLIAGWSAAPHRVPEVKIRVNGRQLEAQTVDRPEILRFLPKDFCAVGFLVNCDLSAIPECEEIRIEVVSGTEKKQVNLPVAKKLKDQLREAVAVERALQATHADWCRRMLACPLCHSKLPAAVNDNIITCRKCNSEFPQKTKAINVISQELSIRSNISSTSNVSFNPYEPLALWLIEEVTGKGGWVLDAGAGSRHRRTKNVINLEIVDYSSTDVLAVGENLPFCDNTFDGIVSLAVLEHVKDPMTCAKELMRVLKPGGRIVCSVPFLQPVHGYPNHYFNMTQEGLKSLFFEGKVSGCFVPPNGHPLLALGWFLREYMAGLPQDLIADFTGMTLGEAAALTLESTLAHPIAIKLNPETSKKISCLNSVIVEKPR